MSGYFWSSKPSDTQIILATLEQQAETINKMALDIKELHELVLKLTEKPKHMPPKPVDINDADLFKTDLDEFIDTCETAENEVFKMELDEFIDHCLKDADHCLIEESDEEDVKELTATVK